MNGRYLYHVGDEVVHSSKPDVFGTITQQVSSDDGDPCDILDPSNPHYHIEWKEEDGRTWIGYEHEYSLLPATANTTPTKVIIGLYKNEPELWERLTSVYTK